jgi:hypothetical protein
MPLNWKFSENEPVFSVSAETPTDKAARCWETLKQHLALGTPVSGRVFIQAPFGVFFDAGLGFPVLMELFSFRFPGMLFPDGYPALDSVITGEVVGFSDDNRQIRVVRNYAELMSHPENIQ